MAGAYLTMGTLCRLHQESGDRLYLRRGFMFCLPSVAHRSCLSFSPAGRRHRFLPPCDPSVSLAFAVTRGVIDARDLVYFFR